MPADQDASVCVPVSCDRDLVTARGEGRRLAEAVGFSRAEATLVATAISELARNIVLYAKCGEIVLRRVGDGKACGISIVARDRGPGIADVPVASSVGYSSSGGLGLGLPGVRRIMDEFGIQSTPGEGTCVTAILWRR